MPNHMTMDRGTQFTSKLWAEVMKLLGVRHTATMSYYPQSNSMVQRLHR